MVLMKWTQASHSSREEGKKSCSSALSRYLQAVVWFTMMYMGHSFTLFWQRLSDSGEDCGRLCQALHCHRRFQVGCVCVFIGGVYVSGSESV